EAAEAMGRVEGLSEQLGARDLAQRSVGAVDLLGAAEVDAEREAAKPVGPRAESRFVVRRVVERDRHAVRALEDTMRRLAARRLRPSERAQEVGHTVDVST